MHALIAQPSLPDTPEQWRRLSASVPARSGTECHAYFRRLEWLHEVEVVAHGFVVHRV